MKGFVLASVACVWLVGCATGSTVAYRAPQITINGAKAEDAKMALVQRCVTNGGSIEENTPHQLVCSKPMDGSFGSLMYRALATPKYSTNPDGKVRYTFVESGGKLFFSADMFLQSQTAFGQVQRTPITNGDVAAKGQAMLNELKAKLEGAATPTPSATSAAQPTAGQECTSCANMRVR